MESVKPVQERINAKKLAREMERADRELLTPVEIITINRHCMNCEFFNRINEHEGDCRKYAPKPFIYDLTKEDGGKYYAIHPLVGNDHWCGEFHYDTEILKNAPRTVSGGFVYVGDKNE